MTRPLCEFCNAVLKEEDRFEHLMEHAKQRASEIAPGADLYDEDHLAALEVGDELMREHPLFEAILNGNTARAGSLLAREPKVSRMRSSSQGFTPLHIAAGQGELEIAQLLVRAGADVDARANEDLTPLHCAAMSGNLEIGIFLMDHGADSSAATSNGLKPTGAANMAGHEHLASLLYMAETLRKRGKHLNPGHSYREVSDELKRKGY